MFDAAQVPAEIRKEYWVEFDKMKEKLNRSTQNKLEAVRWARLLRY